MESPGEHLKRERELRGHTLKKVFEVTRVPLKYLEAIEADDFDSLPQPTFVKGFLRAYCKFLGIDDNDSVLRYDLYQREKSVKPHELTPLPEATYKRQFLPLTAHNQKWILPGLIGVGLVVVIIIYAATRKPAPPQNAVKQEQLPVLQQPAKEMASVVVPDKVESKTKTLTLPPSGKPASVPQTGTQARLKEPLPSAASQVDMPPHQPAVTPENRDEPASARLVTVKPAPKSAHSLYVKATEDTWIKIRIDDAAEPIDVLLRTGESVSWKADNNFSIIVGNAGGVALSLDGSPLGPLGKSGEVISLRLPRQDTTRGETVPKPAQSAPVEKPKE